jgi:hypothetical protein
MDEAFLKTRLEKFIMLIPYTYKIAEPVARAPKGFAAILEREAKVKPVAAEKPAAIPTP